MFQVNVLRLWQSYRFHQIHGLFENTITKFNAANITYIQQRRLIIKILIWVSPRSTTSRPCTRRTQQDMTKDPPFLIFHVDQWKWSICTIEYIDQNQKQEFVNNSMVLVLSAEKEVIYMSHFAQLHGSRNPGNILIIMV